MPAPTHPLTSDQIETFYRALAFADVATARLPSWFKQNAVSMFQKLDSKCDQDKADERARKVADRFEKLKGIRLKTAIVIAILKSPLKDEPGATLAERELSEFQAVWKMFQRNLARCWTLPEFVFEPIDEASGISLSELQKVKDRPHCCVEQIRCCAEGIVTECVLPLVGIDPSNEAIETVFVLMATAVVQRKFKFTSIEAANDFFADRYKEFTEARDIESEEFMTEWGDFIARTMTAKLRQDVPERDQHDVASDTEGKIASDLRKATNPAPGLRLATKSAVATWVRQIVDRSAVDVFRRNSRQEVTSLSDHDPSDDPATEPTQRLINAEVFDRQRLALLMSGLLNEAIELVFGSDSVVADLSAAHQRFHPGAAIAFLMQHRRRNKGSDQNAALEEIALAMAGTSTANWTQFGDFGRWVSPEVTWQRHCPAWNSILHWPGELPEFRVPELWSEIQEVFAGRNEKLNDDVAELFEEWEPGIKPIVDFRLGSVLLVLSQTPFLVTHHDGTTSRQSITREQIREVLVNDEPVIRDTEREWELTCESCWSQATALFPEFGLPASWQTIRAWFDGRINSAASGMIRTLYERALKNPLKKKFPDGEFPMHDRRSETPYRIPRAWCDIDGISDVIKFNGRWYVATAGVDMDSGRSGIQVLASETGNDWQQVGHAVLDLECDLSHPQFVRIHTDNYRTDSVLPDLQCDARSPGGNLRQSRILHYSKDADTWNSPEPILLGGQPLSGFVSSQRRVLVAIRRGGADGAATVALYSGSGLSQLELAADLRQTTIRSHPDAGSIIDDLVYAVDVALFEKDHELWCIAHCAGIDWRRTWIGVCSAADLTNWEWWRAETTVFPHHRFVVPSRTECESLDSCNCELKPYAVCSTADGSWWVSGATHDGSARSDDVLCRIFLPERDIETLVARPAQRVFCAVKRLGAHRTNTVRHVGTASAGQVLVTTFHRRLPVSNGVGNSGRAPANGLYARQFTVLAREFEAEMNV